MGTFSVGGLSTGLDTKSIINQLLQIDSGPKTKLEWKSQLTAARKAAWSELDSRLNTLKTASNALLRAEAWDVSGLPPATPGPMSATSGDPTRLTASVDATAVAGSYAIDVLQRARGEISRSTGADTGAAAADTLTITNGSGSWNIAIDAGDDHATIASKINAASGGAAASIQGGDIQLLSTGIGAAKGFTVTSTGGLAAQLGFSETQSAQDAQYVVDGTLHTATTNSGVTGAIAGVTLSFGDVTSTTLTVAAGAATGPSPEDELLAATKKKITDFVASYNAVLEYSHQKTQGESRVVNPKNLGEYLTGPMARNNQFSGVAFSLRQQMGEEVSGLADGDNLLRDIGITSQFATGGGGSNGKLVIDDAKLTAALKADPDRVKAVLTQSDGANTGAGVGDGFVRRTSELAFTLQGRIDVTEASLDTQVKSLQNSIDNATNRLEKRKLYYERMFSSLETRVGAMQSQQSWLSGQFNSLSG